jgi:arginyl-tRNA--protein-N-Asp/Glu arginylyltransferase
MDGERPGTHNDKDKKTDPHEGAVGEIDRPNRKQKQVQGNFDFLTELHSTESHRAGSLASHIFQVSDNHYNPETLKSNARRDRQLELVKAQATPETFELYDKYQQSVHGDQPGKNSMASFRRFLCSHPLGVSSEVIYLRDV